ncbi:hypothetical protein BT69DRAFT_1317529 [Atractiella rhizophila]|nr:hypothetical protein BT69DRAFT_1317529 [Atractiella rhizophila]
MSSELPDHIPYTYKLAREGILPLEIGMYITTTLFGISLVQVYLVFRKMARLPPSSSTRVTYVFLYLFLVADIIDMILKFSFAADYIADGLVHGLAVDHVPKTVFGLTILGGFIATLTHITYMRRLYRVSKYWKYRRMVLALLAILLCVSLFGFSGAIWTGIVTTRALPTWYPDLSYSASFWLGGASVCDFTLCFLLIFYLKMQQRETDFEKTEKLVGKWVRTTLETGLLPSIVQITDLILSLTYKDKLYHIGSNFIVVKTYINCVLMIMNRLHSPTINRANRSQMSSDPSEESAKIRAYVAQKNAKKAKSARSLGLDTFGADTNVHVHTQVTSDRTDLQMVSLPGNTSPSQEGSRTGAGDDSSMTEKYYDLGEAEKGIGIMKIGRDEHEEMDKYQN